MKCLYLVSMLLVSSVVVLADGNEKWNKYADLVRKMPDEANEQSKDRSSDDFRVTFTCTVPSRSPTRPTSVHELRPGDIDVVSAIGDSLTAANGAKASLITGVLTESRGVSWSIGGEESISTLGTLPNILKAFNPNIHGFSTGNGKVDSSAARLNLAEPGHTSHNMYQQAVNLVNRMRSDPKVDMVNDWKLVTLFIGGNDLCNSCDDVNKYTAANYVNNIRTTLYYLKNNLQRAFINVVESLDVTAIDDLDGSTCRNMQKSLCDCGLSTSYRNTLLKLTKDIQKDTQTMVATEGFNDRNDFAVVLQPFMTEMKAPLLSNGKGDKSYFAPDCFHFSKKGHSSAGTELWNSMLTPVGQKPVKWTIGSAVKCPSLTSPYLFTPSNSRLASKLENLKGKQI